jgi:hypothetical protein
MNRLPSEILGLIGEYVGVEIPRASDLLKLRLTKEEIAQLKEWTDMLRTGKDQIAIDSTSHAQQRYLTSLGYIVRFDYIDVYTQVGNVHYTTHKPQTVIQLL